MVRIIGRQLELRLINSRHCLPCLGPTWTLVAMEKRKLREEGLSCRAGTPVATVERFRGDEVVVGLGCCEGLFREHRVIAGFAKTIGQQPGARRQRLLVERAVVVRTDCGLE